MIQKSGMTYEGGCPTKNGTGGMTTAKNEVFTGL